MMYVRFQEADIVKSIGLIEIIILISIVNYIQVLEYLKLRIVT